MKRSTFAIKLNISIFILFFMFSCANQSNSAILADTIPNNKDIQNISIVSGQYGETSIAIDSNSRLTGVYAYFDQWDEKFKEYTQINEFYFAGTWDNKSLSANIITSWPGEKQSLTGELKIKDGILNIVLSDIPYGYAAVDFRKPNGYMQKNTKRTNWIQIKIVKSEKCSLYDSPEFSTIRKAYIVKNDIVKVISKKDGWINIQYNAPNQIEKSLDAWIQEKDVY